MFKHRKILIKVNLSPGDITTLTYAVTALGKYYGDKLKIGVSTSCMELWENNPYIDDSINEETPGVEIIEANYETIHCSNDAPVSFINGYFENLSDYLRLKIPHIPYYSSIFLSDQEKNYSYIKRIVGKDVPYWILNAGYKLDFTAKQWDFERYAEVVKSCPEKLFVQIGHQEHIHPDLDFPNLINLVGKTSLRNMVGLVYHSFGVVTGVSFPMVLAYSIPPNPIFKKNSRALVVIAGGREPSHWQFPPNAQFLHTCGQLSCCQSGGCWRSRVIPLDETNQDEKDHSTCVKPVVLNSGQIIPECMNRIEVYDVVRSILGYE